MRYIIHFLIAFFGAIYQNKALPWFVRFRAGMVFFSLKPICGAKDDDDPGADILAAVQTEIRTIHDTLKQQVSAEAATKFAETQTALTEIRTTLATMQAAGAAPTEEKVNDLERRLAEQEVAYRELALKAQSQVAPAREVQDEKLFRGKFITDVPKLQSAIRTMHAQGAGGDSATRAIDSTLFTTGGQMTAETFDRFLDFVIEKQVALSRVTTRRMISNQGHTDQLTVARRQLRAAVEGVEPTVRNAIGTRRRTLTTAEVIWPEDITLTFLEDNIERRGAETHIARLLATQFGNDLNDLAWNGDASQDSGGTNDFLSINHGWISLMLSDGNVLSINAASLSTPTNSDILSEAYRNLQVEYQAMPDLAFFTPIKFAQRYAEEVSTRETPLGDQVFINGLPALRYFGLPVIPEPHLYEENLDKVVLTPVSNLYHGIQRSMTMDTEWKPRKRAIEVTITARNDYEYATGEAIILVEAVPAGNR